MNGLVETRLRLPFVVSFVSSVKIRVRSCAPLGQPLLQPRASASAAILFQRPIVNRSPILGGIKLRALAFFGWYCAPRQRAVVVGLMLLSYLLAIVGYPNWQPKPSKDGSQPFPCQFSSCGCRTAEQCRQNCCCHSKDEKIAWALERGIDPNRVVILTPEESARYAQQTLKPKASPVCNKTNGGTCCCQSKSKPASTNACCTPVAKDTGPPKQPVSDDADWCRSPLALSLDESNPAASKRPCCGSKTTEPTDRSAEGATEQNILGWVVGIMAQKCRGTGVDWIQAGFVALPPQTVTLHIDGPSASICNAHENLYCDPILGRLDRPG